MIQDLHSHTYYSFCGKDRPEEIVEAAIAGGVELFGITDHNYGIGHGRYDVFQSQAEDLAKDYGRNLIRYYDHINLIKEKYAGQIQILRGIEICSLNQGRLSLPEGEDISFYDYCLLENLDSDLSVTGGDLFTYAKRLGCPVGIAHTDLFTFIEKKGWDPEEYFARMAKENIFWEMNVSYDSIHNYREHYYMLEFFRNRRQQEIVRNSGVKLSIGFDGHRVEDYLPERVAKYNQKIADMGIKKAFE